MKVFGTDPGKVAGLLAVGRDLTSKDLTPEVEVIPQIDGYDIQGKIAEGGMGTVWRAVQHGTKRLVALKVIAGAVLGSSHAQSRFLREVELTASLECPGITRIYDSGVHAGLFYYAMELIEGEHLDDYVKRAGLTYRQRVELFDRVCAAVQYAHQRGIIHRDLKPSNILVSADGQVHLLDFGLAKAIQDTETDAALSLQGQAIGSLTTMSPEQALGDIPTVGTYSDVYSLTVILYRLLTGQWPYDTSGPRDRVLFRIRTVDPIRPSRLNRFINRDLETVLLKGLEKEPEARYTSVTELRHDLGCWLQDRPILAKSHSSIYLLTKIVRRHRAASATVALLIVIVVCFAYLSFISYLQAKATLEKRQQLDRLSTDMIAQNNSLAAAVRSDLQQHALGWFLLAWHQDRLQEARTMCAYFVEDSHPRLAALFLLDERPLAQKEAGFRAAVGPEGIAFVDFVLGEYYLHHGQRDKAIKAYESAAEGNIDAWLAERIRSRLDEMKTIRQ